MDRARLKPGETRLNDCRGSLNNTAVSYSTVLWTRVVEVGITDTCAALLLSARVLRLGGSVVGNVTEMSREVYWSDRLQGQEVETDEC